MISSTSGERMQSHGRCARRNGDANHMLLPTLEDVTNQGVFAKDKN